jgi:hypothetical protein
MRLATGSPACRLSQALGHWPAGYFLVTTMGWCMPSSGPQTFIDVQATTLNLQAKGV